MVIIELNNTLTEIKNSLGGLSSGVETTEDVIGKFEDISTALSILNNRRKTDQK